MKIEYNDLTGRYEPTGDVTMVGESPYVTGASLADFPDELAQALGHAMSESGIEFDAVCPRCGADMNIWSVPIEPPVVVESVTGHRYCIARRDIFCCPKCGYTRNRDTREKTIKIGYCPCADRLEPCEYCKTPCELVYR